jgi:hypothetical protein
MVRQASALNRALRAVNPPLGIKGAAVAVTSPARQTPAGNRLNYLSRHVRVFNTADLAQGHRPIDGGAAVGLQIVT